MSSKLFSIASLTLFVATGCSFNAGPSGSHDASGAVPQLQRSVRHASSSLISHIVVIVQENRSFENFFAGYPGANAPMSGCAGVNSNESRSARYNRSRPFPEPTPTCRPGDTVVPLHQITFNGPDLEHDWHSSMVEWHKGKMDGFYQFGQKHGQYQAYAYVDRSLIQPYWTMANQYVLADEMFPTEFGGSFTAHLTLVAGTDNITQSPSHAEVDFPSVPPDDCDSPPGTKSSYLDHKRGLHIQTGPFPCFDQFNTMAQVLDGGGVSWKYYATRVLNGGMWSPFEAIKYVRYGPDWSTNIIAPQTQILLDPGSNQLAAVSWVTPSKNNSDHPKDHSDQGPSWVASVVNAIGQSSYWNTSAIIVLWDDWGGWYDNAAPPQLDYRGLGMRVPCLIISPYAKQGYVTHTQLEFGSILRFMEETFNLPPIGSPSAGYTDQRANSLDDAFDFTQSPRQFVPIQGKYSKTHFLHERQTGEPPDNE